MYLEPTVEEVIEGVWSIGGYSLVNTTVIEGENGLIVYDTGAPVKRPSTFARPWRRSVTSRSR